MTVNLAYLQQMTGNNHDIMKEMIQMFLAQLDETSIEMDILFSACNWPELSRLAHKMKSSSLVVGVEMVTGNMIELELLAKEATQPEKCKEYIDRFNELSVQVKAELKECLLTL
ncbi:MAG: Hpt domain-containing protein [Bacteroidales bacterium]|jgi:HPt (histidine-containing phosphotransfer) domain-containing protein|nr:Hpt domain-containing protein [Bacteroidales bacterium]